jgi:hypothetical protein
MDEIMKKDTNLVYENQWCKVVYAGGYYILQSESGNYNDQYYRDLTEVSKKTGIPLRTMRDFSHPHLTEKV